MKMQIMKMISISISFDTFECLLQKTAHIDMVLCAVYLLHFFVCALMHRHNKVGTFLLSNFQMRPYPYQRGL